MSFHPSVRVAAHKKYADEIKKNLFGAGIIQIYLRMSQRIQYDSFMPEKVKKAPFEEVLYEVGELLNGKIKVLIMNGENTIESDEYSSGCNFVVGGNTLGRGLPSWTSNYLLYTNKQKATGGYYVAAQSYVRI